MSYAWAHSRALLGAGQGRIWQIGYESVVGARLIVRRRKWHDRQVHCGLDEFADIAYVLHTLTQETCLSMSVRMLCHARS